MAHIDVLIEQIVDPDLKQRIAEQVRLLVDRKDFGLVFQDHLPESIEVPKGRPRPGDRARLRSDPDGPAVFVSSTLRGTATVAPIVGAGKLGEPREVSFEQLNVLKDFGEPIYAGLHSLGRVGQGEEKPTHVVIKAENYYALETLLYTHEASVDVIYIDPPYNTGNAEWQYNDRYVDSNDVYRHSKWLAFMQRRLAHARSLLKPSGLLLVSIDDREAGTLRLLLDSVMGADNWVQTFVWRTDGHFDNQAQIKSTHEYIYAYARSKNDFRVAPAVDPNLPEDSKIFNLEVRNSVVKNGPKNPVSEVVLPVGFPATFESGVIPARRTAWPRFDDDIIVEGYAMVNEVVVESGWANGRLLRQFIAGDFTPILDTKGQETRFEVTHTGAIDNVKGRSADQSHVVSVLMNLGTTEKASATLKRMGLTFSYPKPVALIEYLIKLSGGPNAVVLDFFAGSGTTAEAVMRLNSHDGGSRQSITVTNNELSQATSKQLGIEGYLPGDAEWEARGIFHAVTRPRIESVVTGRRGDGTVFSRPLAETVEFFEITYEDEIEISLGKKFESIAPLLWLKAGGIGNQIKAVHPQGWDIAAPGTYGVLFDTSAWRGFVDAVNERRDGITHVYVVTDSEAEFQTTLRHLPRNSISFTATRLYSDYLRSFQINGRD